MSGHERPTRTAVPPTLPATLRLGAVHLTVSDLDRSVAFYEEAIGLRLHHREDRVATMGAGGGDLLVLHEEPAARRASRWPLSLRASVRLPRGPGARGAAAAATKTPI